MIKKKKRKILEYNLIKVDNGLCFQLVHVNTRLKTYLLNIEKRSLSLDNNIKLRIIPSYSVGFRTEGSKKVSLYLPLYNTTTSTFNFPKIFIAPNNLYRDDLYDLINSLLAKCVKDYKKINKIK